MYTTKKTWHGGSYLSCIKKKQHIIQAHTKITENIVDVQIIDSKYEFLREIRQTWNRFSTTRYFPHNLTFFLSLFRPQIKQIPSENFSHMTFFTLTQYPLFIHPNVRNLDHGVIEVVSRRVSRSITPCLIFATSGRKKRSSHG